MEPEKPVVTASIGPSFLFEDRLSASSKTMVLGVGIEYPLSKELSVLGELNYGLASTQQLKLRAGGRYRLVGFDFPIAPTFDAQLVAGQLFDVLGTDLGFFGLRLGTGVDYFLTDTLLAGLGIGLEFNRTTAERSVGFEQLDLVLRVAYVF